MCKLGLPKEEEPLLGGVTLRKVKRLGVIQGYTCNAERLES
jgi:hypothetical protein